MPGNAPNGRRPVTSIRVPCTCPHSNPVATRSFVALFAPPKPKTMEEQLKEQAEMEAEAAEEGAPAVPLPQVRAPRRRGKCSRLQTPQPRPNPAHHPPLTRPPAARHPRLTPLPTLAPSHGRPFSPPSLPPITPPLPTPSPSRYPPQSSMYESKFAQMVLSYLPELPDGVDLFDEDVQVRYDIYGWTAAPLAHPYTLCLTRPCIAAVFRARCVMTYMGRLGWIAPCATPLTTPSPPARPLSQPLLPQAILTRLRTDAGVDGSKKSQALVDACDKVGAGVRWAVVWAGYAVGSVLWWCGLGMLWAMVWCGGVGWAVMWCGVVWCGVVWCGVVWCGLGRPQSPGEQCISSLHRCYPYLTPI